MCGLTLLGVLGGCAEEGQAPVDPEIDHCVRAAQRLVSQYLDDETAVAVIVETQAWTVEDEMRNVRVRFEYPPNAEDLTFGSVVCVYGYSLEVRNDPDRKVISKTITFRGRNLPPAELLLLNAKLRGTR